MAIGVIVVLGVLAVATVAGLLQRSREGRVRAGHHDEAVPGELRERVDAAAAVTLVQLSTTFCAPCRQTKVLLSDLAQRTDGLAHVDVDVTDKVELAESIGVRRTPTTLAVNRSGVELFRMSGVPQRDQVLHALRTHLPSGPDGDSQSADGAPA
jgi:thiol-disulfide isomerase/thioredoxin